MRKKTHGLRIGLAVCAVALVGTAVVTASDPADPFRRSDRAEARALSAEVEAMTADQTAEQTRPPIDLDLPEVTQTATFALG